MSRRRGYGPNTEWQEPTEEQRVRMWRSIAAWSFLLYIVGGILQMLGLA